MGVSQSMVIVEDENGSDTTGSNHEHDAGEVCSFSKFRITTVLFLKNIQT